MNKKAEGPNDNPNLTKSEREDVKERVRPRVPILYEIIRQEGEAELERPLSGLWFSGIAAGISIGFSMVTEGLLRAHLPDAPWRPLVDNLGYTMGFLIVILGRQQLFTENTITAVLPVMARKGKTTLMCMLRLWAVVLAANLVGAFLIAVFCSKSGLFAPEVEAAFAEIARHLTGLSPGDTFWRGIVAGWLIAVLVWVLPNSKGNEIFVIVLITYVIALGDFTHCIAGSVEAFWLVLNGDLGPFGMVFGFLVPTLLGNVFGGTVLFAMLSYVQVHEEL